MRQIIITAIVALAANTAQADTPSSDCAALGLTNSYLTDHFCSQLEALVTPEQTTRSIVLEGDPDADLTPVAEWENIGLIQDAFRADPRKTLELIERIKGAGGLANEITN